MVKRVNILLVAILLVFSISFISAPLPPQTNINIEVGLEIQYPPLDILEQGEDFEFQFHIFNKSDGLAVNNVTTSCRFHLYNNTGFEFIDELLIMHPNLIDFQINVTGSNFTTGFYSYIVQCNASDVGGFVTVPIEVTPTGQSFDSGETLSATGIMLGVLILAFFFMALGFKLGSDDKLIPVSFLIVAISIGLAIYSLFLAFAISSDMIQYGAISGTTEIVFVAVLWIIIGAFVLFMALMLIAFIKELSEVVEKKKFGDNWDPISKTYT